VELPDSLQRLVLARLDQLNEGEKATIKAASVIGRVFPANWIWGSYPQVGTAEKVLGYLERLDALDLTPLRSSRSELEYGFKHAIIQEVAYGSLAFGMRETLHEGVAGFVERSCADRLDQYVDLLAHHYGRTRNVDKQQVWFRAAGDAAKTAFANQAAVDHYERLLPLLSEPQAGEVLLELGAVWQLTGRWADAERAHLRAMGAAERTGSRHTLAASRRDMGVLAPYTRPTAEAVRWLSEARPTSSGSAIQRV
jgi:hypothetical protein